MSTRSMVHGFFRGVIDSFRGIRSIVLLAFYQRKPDGVNVTKARNKSKSMPDPQKPVRKIMQCCALNGGIFLLSLLVWGSVLLPVLERISPSPVAWRYLYPVLNSLFSVMWIIPLFLISRIINFLWFQDIADYTFSRTHGRVPRVHPFGKLIADVLLSVFIQFLFLVQSLIVTSLPIVWVGNLLGLLHRSFLYSLYAFEYKWFSLGWALDRRLEEIELHWPYFVGFGLPMSVLTSFHDSYFMSFPGKDTSMEYVGEHLAADLREVKTTEHLLGLMKNLKLSIEQKDEEIERICNGSYEDFISSFQEFVQHRRESEKVREELETIMEMSKSSGREIVLLGKEVDKAQVVLENIEKAMTTLSSCLPVLEAYSRLEKEISQKDYFNSLKSLEALESDLLPKLFPYNFASQMRQRLPVLKQEIKTAAQSELKDYLLNVRRLAPKIGRIAVDQAVKSSDAVEEVAAQNMVDLTPVHHCLHLYTLLESRQEFIDYYRIQRKKQVQLALEPPSNMHASENAYEEYLLGVVGFFAVEHRLAVSSSDLVSRAFLTSLWEEALAKIKQTIGNEASVSTDLTQMIRIKELILTFCHALKGFDLQIKDMMVIVSGIQDHYISLLMKKFVEIFRVIFNEDDYQPMEVRTEEEWRRLADAFPVVTETTEGQTAVAATNKFPRKFPFSAMVPKVFEQVKQFVDECLAFSSGMGLNIAQVRDAIRKWTKDLLSCTLCGCLCALLKKPTLGLTHLMQIFVNMNHLEEAKHHVEAYIGAVTGWTGDAATLDRKDMFKEACAEAEHQIYEKLREKIDEFVELNSYDWMLDEAEGHASSYMLDLVAFLENTFQAFVNRGLPLKVGTAACIHACQHIGQKMLPVLLDPGIKQMTNGALMQFNMDVLQCEQFACSAPIPGIDETALLLCFADVRQILDLFTAWDWSTYFHDVGKEKSKYLRVSPQVALMLLERLDRGSEKKPLFTSLKKTERDKKKLMEAVQKQLKYLCRSQQQDNHSAS